MITGFVVENYRGVTRVAVSDVETGVYLRGRNGSGKSSTLDAIRLAIFGRCADTDDAGRGRSGAIRDGAKQFAVAVQMQRPSDGERVEIALTHRGAKSELSYTILSTGEVLDTPEAFWAWYGIPKKHAELSAALAAYLERDADAKRDDSFGAVIAEYLAEDVGLETIIAQSGANDAWLRARLTDWGRTPRTMADWKSFGEGMAEARKEKNAEVKQIQRDIEVLGFVAPPVDARGTPIPVTMLSQVQMALADVETQRDVLQQELGASRGGRSAAQIAVDREACAARLATAQELEGRARAALATVSERDRALDSGLQAALTRRSAVTAALMMFRRTVTVNEEILAGATDACPRCGQALSPGAQTKLFGPIRAELEQARGQVATAEQQIAGCDAEHESLRALRSEHEAVIRSAQDAVGTVVGRTQTARDEHARVQAEKPAGRPADVITAEIAALDVRIAAGGEKLDALKRLANIAGMTARLTEVQMEVAHLNWAVLSFRDGELLKRITTGSRKNEFLGRCNAELEPFGYRMDIDPLGKQLRLMAGRVGAAARPWAQCSKGEQVIVMFAVALAFGGDAAPVILDDVDGVDDDHKQVLLARLKRCAGGVILAGHGRDMTAAELSALEQAFAPARLVWIADGETMPEVAA